MLTDALTNILGHDNRGDRPLEILLMAAWGVQGELDRLSQRVMRWINGTREATWRTNPGWVPQRRNSLERCLSRPGLGPA